MSTRTRQRSRPASAAVLRTPLAPGLAEVLNLDLPRSVSYFTDDQVQQFGSLVFLAVPNRNQLDFHVLRDQTAVASLRLLAGFAAAGMFPGR